MRNQPEKIIRLLALLLAGLVVWQLAQAVYRANPLGRVTIPAVPNLTTNEPAGEKPVAANLGLVAKATTNGELAKVPTNHVSATNKISATNALADVLKLPIAGHPISVATNAAMAATNLIAAGGSNAIVVATNDMANTNVMAKKNKRSRPVLGDAPDLSMMGGPFSMPGKRAGKLPPEIQMRVDKIVDSEIFAAVMHPLPMALMGIAGDVAFLRSATGQTGLVKTGDSLSEIKLLRIGINRVLVEVDGQKQELTIFEGYGGESLLPKQNETAP